MYTIAIPAERDTDLLNRVIDSVNQYEPQAKLDLLIDDSINVSEARQIQMDRCITQYICFLDSDSIMLMPWLNNMRQVLDRPECGAVFAREWWGTEPLGGSFHIIDEVNYGPAACMLLDRSKIPASLKWDHNIGLRSGWMGGDAEEVEYQYKLKYLTNLKFYMCHDIIFHHTGNKTTKKDFWKTDRIQTYKVMLMLMDMKYAVDPTNDDWFKGLKYVPAHDNNDCMFAPGYCLRDCYHDIVVRHNMGHRRFIKELGL